MDFKHRILFNKVKDKELINFFDEQKIDYENTEFSFVILEVLESNKFWSEINKYLIAKNITSLTEGVYSKREIEQARWISIRSKLRWQYPQPAGNGNYKNITYSKENYCNQCKTGLTQIDSFRVKKTPRWRKNCFLMLNWIEDELFLSDNAKNILTNSGMRGFRFFDVVKNDSTKLEDFNQLKVNEILSPGLIDQDNTIKEMHKCNKCGVTKYVTSGRGLVYREVVFRNDVDMVNSFELFGLSGMRDIFINQKFYQVIINNGMDKNIEFVPIKLI